MKTDDALIARLNALCLRYSVSGEALDGRYEVAKRAGLTDYTRQPSELLDARLALR